MLTVIDRMPLIGSGFVPALPPSHRDATDADLRRDWPGWLANSPAARELLAELGTSAAELQWGEIARSGVSVIRCRTTDNDDDEREVFAAGLRYCVHLSRPSGNSRDSAVIALNDDGTRGAILTGWE